MVNWILDTQERDPFLDAFTHVLPLIASREARATIHLVLQRVKARLDNFRARVKAPHVAQSKRFQPTDAQVRVKAGPHAPYHVRLPVTALQNEALSGQSESIEHVAKESPYIILCVILPAVPQDHPHVEPAQTAHVQNGQDLRLPDPPAQGIRPFRPCQAITCHVVPAKKSPARQSE